MRFLLSVGAHTQQRKFHRFSYGTQDASGPSVVRCKVRTAQVRCVNELQPAGIAVSMIVKVFIYFIGTIHWCTQVGGSGVIIVYQSNTIFGGYISVNLRYIDIRRYQRHNNIIQGSEVKGVKIDKITNIHKRTLNIQNYRNKNFNHTKFSSKILKKLLMFTY